MPQFDQTGPDGHGAMTGRKAGRCTNYGAGKSAPEGNPADESNERGVFFLRNRGIRRGGGGRGMRMINRPGGGGGRGMRTGNGRNGRRQ